MNKYGLHGKLKAKKDNGEKLASILLQASELVAKSEGCRLYLVSRDKSDKETIWITEVWDTKEDHDNSLKYPGVRELISQAMPILDGMPEKGQELDILGGAGL